MAASRHGAAVEMLGCLGDDDMGAQLRARLAEAGVGLGHVHTVDVGSGMSVALQQDDGDYAAVVVSGANLEIDSPRVQADAALIMASDVLLLQNEIDAEASAAAAVIARAAGGRVVHNAAPARDPGAMAGLADVLVLNAVEAEQLGAAPVRDLASALDAARTLREAAPAVVVTAGGAGLAAVTPDEVVELPAHPVESADMHGAGDVFTGALGARLAAGEPLAAALRYANAAAAIHVGTPEAERTGVGPVDVRSLLRD
jgi:ribokinase